MPEYRPGEVDIVACARQEAQRLGYPFIQREQLFLGLLHDPAVARILASLGIDLTVTREQVESRILPGLGAPDDPGEIGMLPTAEQVLNQRAQTASALLGHTHVGAEHVLLGFLLEQHGEVREVLHALGVTKEKVMDAIKQAG